jgi:hypothetical protein
MKEKNTNKNAEISARVHQIIEHLGVTSNKFAQKLGYERAQTVYDILNGKSAPSFDFFRRFQLSEYSEIVSIDWILTNRGGMLNKQEIPKQSDSTLGVFKELLSERDKKIEELNREVGRLEAELRLVKEELAQRGGGGLDVAGDAGCAAVG